MANQRPLVGALVSHESAWPTRIARCLSETLLQGFDNLRTRVAAYELDQLNEVARVDHLVAGNVHGCHDHRNPP